MATTHNLLLLPGDGIGVETMAEVERVRRLLQQEEQQAKFETDSDLVGGAAYDKHGVPITERGDGQGQKADAIHLRRRRRAEVGQRPLRAPPRGRPAAAAQGPRPFRQPAPRHLLSRRSPTRPRLKRELVEGLDIMIVRELTGGTYFGEPKEIVTLENGEKRAVDTTVYTTHEIERIAKVAFDLAAQARQQGALGRQAQRHAHRRAVEAKSSPPLHKALRAGRRARAHPRRQLRHAARAQSQAVRRHA